MKRFVVLSFLLCTFFSQAWSQDTLVKRSGEKMLVKVLEVNTTDIKFKRFNNQDGPEYSIYKTEVQYIVYSNGLRENYDKELPPPVPAPPTVIVQAAPAEDENGRYDNIKMSESDLFARAEKQKDPKIKLLAKETKARKSAQYGLGAGGLFLGVASSFIFLSSLTQNSGSQVNIHDREVATVMALQLALVCEVSSLCFKIERKNHNALLLDAFNGKKLDANNEKKQDAYKGKKRH